MLDTPERRMLGSSRQPQAHIEPALSGYRYAKAHASLKNNPRLLSIDGDRSALPRDGAELVKQLWNDWILELEVIGKLVPATRVPEIARDKTVPTAWTRPKRRSAGGSHESARWLPQPLHVPVGIGNHAKSP